MTVRHPFARLYSAWKDKFRNGHPWAAVIRKKFGKFIEKLEKRDMANEEYEVSFEAYLELVAIQKFELERDRQWFHILMKNFSVLNISFKYF